ncbi:hypothetical protein [Rhizobium sp. TRM95796]|uniref:hypothetical protein n=1 Tax=Rhizobium sp. TRM95796 TaxID=2979862 RepID=UPI0021E7A343|nr:hypothetical protein [Rhizobium sp. TRM95796]MCV3767155.1 hypothetical protein [Rhizobium sp. TRM95796]
MLEDEEQSGKLIVLRSVQDADALVARLEMAAAQTAEWVAAFRGRPLDLIRHMKFDTIGFHPVDHHPLNVIEQVNQTWTYVVAALAARKLFELHPEAGALHLAPGAHASQPLDVMSEVQGLVGAETFAAVRPENNAKLAKDLAKLSARQETHRYIFFMSPKYPGTQRLPKLERDGVQVWSVDIS